MEKKPSCVRCNKPPVGRNKFNTDDWEFCSDVCATEWIGAIARGLMQSCRFLDNYCSLRTNESFYDSKEWVRLRYVVLEQHGSKCQACGLTPLDGIRIHVDHIKPISKYPELKLEQSNLQVLCETCNFGKSNKSEKDWRPPKGDVKL